MQIMLVFEIQIFVHQIQPVDFWFNISYSVYNFVYAQGAQKLTATIEM